MCRARRRARDEEGVGCAHASHSSQAEAGGLPPTRSPLPHPYARAPLPPPPPLTHKVDVAVPHLPHSPVGGGGRGADASCKCRARSDVRPDTLSVESFKNCAGGSAPPPCCRRRRGGGGGPQAQPLQPLAHAKNAAACRRTGKWFDAVLTATTATRASSSSSRSGSSRSGSGGGVCCPGDQPTLRDDSVDQIPRGHVKGGIPHGQVCRHALPPEVRDLRKRGVGVGDAGGEGAWAGAWARGTVESRRRGSRAGKGASKEINQ